MSVTTDKRKVNYIIACGYCLVVIIILFNYLRTPRKTAFREGTRAAHPNQALDLANKELENQLNEQKRMNKEMREMLIDIHKTGVTASQQPTSNYVSNNNAPTPATSQNIINKPLTDINIKSYDLPEIDSEIGVKFKKDPVYPFEANKNPFAISEGTAENIDTEDGLSFHGQTVVCNPILPYMFSSSNSDFKLISNY